MFDAKRLIGRRFDDPDVKKDMVHWPFTVVDKDGSPFIEVRSHIEGSREIQTFSSSLRDFHHRAGGVPEREEAVLSSGDLIHGPLKDERNC